MKKLYRSRGTVHPSPPITTDPLSFLPATILTLAAALSPQDRQVLAYLISCSNNDFENFSSHRKNTPKNPTKRSSSSSDHDHPPLFTCDCFRCYMSYWVRWDSSPNRQLIHEIIDAFEEALAQSNKTKSKKDRKKKGGAADGSGGSQQPNLSVLKGESSELKSVEQSSSSSSSNGSGSDSGISVEVCGDDGEEGTDKGSVRRFVNFIGERIWNVWGQ